jgi:hypothetical protein
MPPRSSLRCAACVCLKREFVFARVLRRVVGAPGPEGGRPGATGRQGDKGDAGPQGPPIHVVAGDGKRCHTRETLGYWR